MIPLLCGEYYAFQISKHCTHLHTFLHRSWSGMLWVNSCEKLVHNGLSGCCWNTFELTQVPMAHLEGQNVLHSSEYRNKCSLYLNCHKKKIRWFNMTWYFCWDCVLYLALDTNAYMLYKDCQWYLHTFRESHPNRFMLLFPGLKARLNINKSKKYSDGKYYRIYLDYVWRLLNANGYVESDVCEIVDRLLCFLLLWISFFFSI